MFHQLFRWLHQGVGRPEGAQFATIACFSTLLALNLFSLFDWLSTVAPDSELLETGKLVALVSIIFFLPLHLFLCVRKSVDVRIAQNYENLTLPRQRKIAVLMVLYAVVTAVLFHFSPESVAGRKP